MPTGPESDPIEVREYVSETRKVFYGNTPAPEPDEDKGYWWRLHEHFYTNMLVSLLFFLCIQPFEGSALFRTLDRMGTDALVQNFTPWGHAAYPPVFVVDLGPEPKASDIAETLESVRRQRPKAIGLDLFLVKSLAAGTVKTLADAVNGDSAPGGSTPVVLPILNPDFQKEVKLRDKQGHVVEAAVNFARDEDGMVRTTYARECAVNYSGEPARLPSLAAGMVYGTTGNSPLSACVDDDGQPILFVQVKSLPTSGALPVPLTDPAIYIITREMLPKAKDSHGAVSTLLKDAYVILGQATPNTIEDHFTTPAGELPGSIIHAEAVWTTLYGKDRGDTWLGRLQNNSVFDIVFTLAGAAFGGIVTAAFAAKFPTQEIKDGPGALRRFCLGLVSLLLNGIVIVIVGFFWTLLAALLIGTGVFISAATAMFGAMLESLAHTGSSIVEPIKWVATRLMVWGKRSALLGVLCLLPVCASAAECAYTSQPALDDKKVTIATNNPKSSPERRFPFDRVTIKGPATSVTFTREGTEDAFTLHGSLPAVSFVLPPCPTRPLAARFWDAFWIKPEARTSAPGATPVFRGWEHGDSLRELTNLAEARGTVAGATGLALAWAGGTAPYTVAFQDEASGKPLGDAHSSKTTLWLPDWQTPAAPYAVTITDAAGATVSFHLRPLRPAPVSGNEIADAIELFQTAPDYRLEALRLLAARAEKGDDLAEKAVALIDASGSVQ